MNITDPFWTENMTVLFSRKRLHEFWPSAQLSFYEQANAVTRFLIYAGILLSFANKNSMYLVYALLVVIFIAIVVLRKAAPVLSRSSKKSGHFPKLQKMNKKSCTKPTEENPFGNVLMHEYQDNPQRLSACDSEIVKDEVNNKFFSDFNQDPYDVFNRKHSQRQFFSTANTQIPNDQDSFAHWLYGKEGPTCKENALMCKGNEAFGSGGN